MDLIDGGFFLGSDRGDSKEKGPGRVRPAECFSENAVYGKTILDFLREAQTLPGAAAPQR